MIPDVSITLTNTATNVVLKTRSNVTGFYLFPGVIPAPYLLTAEAVGMQKFEGSVTVQVQQSAAIDITLRVGQTVSTVAVQDVTPMMQTDNPPWATCSTGAHRAVAH